MNSTRTGFILQRLKQWLDECDISYKETELAESNGSVIIAKFNYFPMFKLPMKESMKQEVIRSEERKTIPIYEQDFIVIVKDESPLVVVSCSFGLGKAENYLDDNKKIATFLRNTHSFLLRFFDNKVFDNENGIVGATLTEMFHFAEINSPAGEARFFKIINDMMRIKELIWFEVQG